MGGLHHKPVVYSTLQLGLRNAKESKKNTGSRSRLPEKISHFFLGHYHQVSQKSIDNFLLTEVFVNRQQANKPTK